MNNISIICIKQILKLIWLILLEKQSCGASLQRQNDPICEIPKLTDKLTQPTQI